MTDVYEIVTERICKLLEQGTVPWQQPWSVATGQPRNLVSKKPYRGINIFLLAATGYSSPYWLTFNQARQLGGTVKKGEKGSMVVFFKVDKVQDRNDPEKESTRWILRYYTVFNVSQCEGIDAKVPAIETKDDVDPIEAAEAIIANMPNRPDISYEGSKAFYSPLIDKITLPPKATFNGGPEFYSTAFHEMTHSTGHESRCNRKEGMTNIKFGSESYSKEELVAEMGSAFLCAEAGIVDRTINNSAAYINSWLKVLKGDKYLVVRAASGAQAASDYILNRKAKSED